MFFYDVKLFTFGSTFLSDLKSSENINIDIQECYFLLKNLGADAGLEIISNYTIIFIIRSYFHFESELNMTFKYFLKANAAYFMLKFEKSIINMNHINFFIISY